MAKATHARLRSAEQPVELDPAQDPFSGESIRHLVARYGSPLFIIDAERVRAQYFKLAAALPGVDLYYAVKCLPHSALITALRAVGGHFDLATNGEVELVRALGVEPGRCLHTHPIKRERDIRTALSFGVTRFVVDNPDELRKFEKFRSEVSLLIRVAFRGTGAVCDFSAKFGCEPDAVADLLSLAAQLRIRIEGLSFHAGSQAADPAVHVEAIEVCRELMLAAVGRGHDLDTLDIGGGFPVEYTERCPPIGDFCAPIRAALCKIPAPVRVIAEPGRFIAAPACIAVASVMGRALREGRWWYYLDDGLYGSYSGKMFDRVTYPLEALVPPGPTYRSVLAGPTCDSVDVVAGDIDLPKLDVDDLIVGRAMGAYTWASASEFNFFPRAAVLALDRGRLLREGESA